MSFSNLRAIRVAVLASALAVSAGASLVVTPAPAVLADAVDDGIKAMKDFEKAGEENKCVSKMQELRDGGNPKALAPIKSLAMSSKSDKVRCAAIKAVAITFHDSAFHATLVKWLDDKDLRDLAEKGGRPEVYQTAIDAIGAYKSPKSLDPLADVVKKYLADNRFDYASHAIRAYGTVVEKPVVDQLIKWGEEADSRGGGQNGSTESTDARAAKDKAKAAVMQTLLTLCGDEMGADIPSWKKWWEEKKKTFTFPKPEDASKQVDVTTLNEWTDPTYGYKVTKPKGWVFKPKDEWYRIQCIRIDDKDMWWTYAGWGIFSLIGSKTRDVKDYANWWMTDQLLKEIGTFSNGGEPKLETKMIGKREWLIVDARGEGKDTMKNWQVMERRIYMTQMERKILYCSSTVRSGAEKEEKDLLWKTIEDTCASVPPPAK